MTRVIGIDVGGSKTLGLLVDESGTVLARARASGGNPHSVGREKASASLREVLLPLVASGSVAAVCIGAAGLARESDREFFEAAARALVSAETKLLLRNDAQVALRAGTKTRPAAIVIAGTGSLVYGERRDGEGVRRGGYGALIGDTPGAYAIGLAAVRHLALVLDELEAPSELSSSVLENVNAGSIPELVDRVHHWPPDVGAIAALASLVGDAAQRGDPAAQRIVARSCDELAAQVRAVSHAVRTPSVLPVLASGGAFDAVPDLFEAVRAGAQATGQCQVGRLALEPAHGAALLGLEAAGCIPL